MKKFKIYEFDVELKRSEAERGVSFLDKALEGDHRPVMIAEFDSKEKALDFFHEHCKAKEIVPRWAGWGVQYVVGTAYELDIEDGAMFECLEFSVDYLKKIGL